jgi:RHS repeat-associated protein
MLVCSSPEPRQDSAVFPRAARGRNALREFESSDPRIRSPNVPRQLIRFQITNHLGSAIVELDEQARIISYEEYSPYGSTTYQAVRSATETPKRYRYAGKERDENGLYYNGSRYYCPWLGRWTSPTGWLTSSDLPK